MNSLKCCNSCKHNGLVTEYDYEFCVFCESIFTIHVKTVKKSSFHVSNKLIHLRNVLRRLLSRQCSSHIIDEIMTDIERYNISSQDVDANFVSNFLKEKDKINKKDYKLVFEIINHVRNDTLNLTTEKINEIVEIFKLLVFFTQENTESKTINYSFFLDKIFNVIGVTANLKPQTVKNYAKNNYNQLTWEKFLRFLDGKCLANNVADYGHEYVFWTYDHSPCSLEV
ncbi:ORF160 [Saltwater crocodilepox virus]|nr:late transcription factor VLTF-3 [Saltwater crocodilepox virus]AVD69494.1 late transcription factor VLTF-3 [Saltwater crocodilepox virus]QGT46597.1 ORF160 [Saltwater crocodilepox virus]QGT46814.1 ORF160 [Saltwater crocodilepox virus]QGT47029.1 ORF160 [Saltwater crocodilepox virus]